MAHQKWRRIIAPWIIGTRVHLKYIILLFVTSAWAQTQPPTMLTIKGNFNTMKNTEITLTAYNGLQEKEVAKTTSDSLGNFTLNYPINYRGAGLLKIKNSKNVIVLLNDETFTMEWANVEDFNTMKITHSAENQHFAEGIKINQEAEQKLAGLNYLLPLYQGKTAEQKWISNELEMQKTAFDKYVFSLPQNSYVKYYLNLRKQITNIAQTAKQHKEQFATYEKVFNTINFNDPQLLNSGLLKELLEGYFSLLESNLENPNNFEIINKQFKTGITAIIKTTQLNPTQQEEIAHYLFQNFEKRNLDFAAEHLALQMLNQTNCQISQKNKNLFEQYRKLAIGNTAPDILFPSGRGVSEGRGVALSTLPNQYKLVVFGASNCPNCQTDYPSLIGVYNRLKEKYNLEVVYISIDTDKTEFEKYFKDAPFISYCDYKGWETQPAKDYLVHATPTYYLLNKDLKILMKIKTPEHLEAWLINE